MIILINTPEKFILQIKSHLNEEIQINGTLYYFLKIKLVYTESKLGGIGIWVNTPYSKLGS